MSSEFCLSHDDQLEHCTKLVILILQGARGGAIASFQSTEITNSTFRSCTVDTRPTALVNADGKGGALYVDTSTVRSGENLYIANSNFSSNTALGSMGTLGGSAVFTISRYVTIQNTVFVKNVASSIGSLKGGLCSGALHVRDALILDLKRTLFSSNRVETEYSVVSEGAAASIKNCSRVYLVNVTAEFNVLVSHSFAVRGAISVTNTSYLVVRALTLRGNAIAQSFVKGEPGPYRRMSGGGAFWGRVDSVEMLDCVVQENRIHPRTHLPQINGPPANGCGGGVAVEDAQVLILKNSTFHDNAIEGVTSGRGNIVFGGGLCGLRIAMVSVYGSQFTNNTLGAWNGNEQTEPYGGALFLESSVVVITATEFNFNGVGSRDGTVGFGGAIGGIMSSLSVVDCWFVGNFAIASFAGYAAGGGYGGGMAVEADFLYLLEVLFEDNIVMGEAEQVDQESASGGGALFLSRSLMLIIDSSSFNNNVVVATADKSESRFSGPLVGGAIADRFSQAMLIFNCQFSNNSVSGSGPSNPALGGAIYHAHESTFDQDFFYIFASRFWNNSVHGVSPVKPEEDGGFGCGGAVMTHAFGTFVPGYLVGSRFLVVDSTFLYNAAHGGNVPSAKSKGGSALGAALAVMNFDRVAVVRTNITRSLTVPGSGDIAGLACAAVFFFANHDTILYDSHLSLGRIRAANSFLSGSSIVGSSLFVQHFHNVTVERCSFDRGLAKAGNAVNYGGHAFGVIFLQHGNHVSFVNNMLISNYISGGDGHSGEAGTSNGILLATNVSRTVTINYCFFSDNTVMGGCSSKYAGGDGVSIVQTTSNLQLYNTLFIGNFVLGGKGNRGGGWALSIVLVLGHYDNSFNQVDLCNSSLVDSRIAGGDSELGVGGAAVGCLVIHSNTTQARTNIRNCMVTNTECTSGRSRLRDWSHGVRGGSLWIAGDLKFLQVVEISDSRFTRNLVFLARQ